MKHPAVLFVALVATAVICVQNAGAALAFGWGLIHGAGPAALLMWAPMAAGVALLWTGFVLLRRSRISGAPVIFTIYALGLLLVNELVLPMTPLEAWRGRRSLDAVEVRDIRDEPFLSARGNPIGIRLTYEARFPAAVTCSISATVFMPVTGQDPYPLQLAHGHARSIEPSPEPRDGYHIFQEDTVYRFTETTLPNFLSYDERTQEPCLARVPVAETEFFGLLSKAAPAAYRTDIVVTSDFADTMHVIQTYVTSREYDVKSMYEAMVREGHKRCGS